MACAVAVANAEDLQVVQEAEQAKKQEAQQQAQQAHRQAVEKQRQQQIDQHAKHTHAMVMPALQAELELVRKTCGSLPSEARKKIVAAGNAAVQTVARQVAEQQMGGQLRPFDSRKVIREAVAAAVKPHATAEEFAAYEQEQAARIARRNRAARMLIVNKVDGEIQLSQAQREKIEADLENRWDAKWLQALHDTGVMIINNRPPAPDFADKCIAPHLDERQRAEWKTWCGQAGASRHGQHYGWDFDGQGMQPDPWWSR
jgi:hypothetical protein